MHGTLFFNQASQTGVLCHCLSSKWEKNEGGRNADNWNQIRLSPRGCFLESLKIKQMSSCSGLYQQETIGIQSSPHNSTSFFRPCLQIVQRILCNRSTDIFFQISLQSCGNFSCSKKAGPTAHCIENKFSDVSVAAVTAPWPYWTFCGITLQASTVAIKGAPTILQMSVFCYQLNLRYQLNLCYLVEIHFITNQCLFRRK